MERIQQLVADIQQHRGADTVVGFQQAAGLSPNEPSVLNGFVESLGLSGIGDQWKEITREAAVSLVTAVLSNDLAYHVRMMPEDVARELAERFTRVFATDARFFTNTNYTVGVRSCAWSPLTASTFDAGVLGVDASTIGMLVVQDED